MSSFDQEQLGKYLTAYLDGELAAEEISLIERILRESAEARRLLEELRTTLSLVSSLPRHGAPASVIDDIERHIERDGLLGEVEEAPAPRRKRGAWRVQLATAAMMGLIVVGGLWAFVLQGGRENGGAIDKLALRTEEPALPLTPRGSLESKRRTHGASRKIDIGKSAAPEQTEKGEGAATDSYGVRSDADRRAGLARVLSLGQKVEAGVFGKELLDHAFASEANVLRVAFADDADRDAVSRRLKSYLDAGKIAELGDVVASSRGSITARAVYYEGRPGINVPRKSGPQILVRLPAREVAGLVAELTKTAPQAKRVEMRAGPFVADGWEQTTALVQQMTRRPVEVAGSGRDDGRLGGFKPPDARKRGAGQGKVSPSRKSGALDRLLSEMGLDREMLDDLRALEAEAGEPAQSEDETAEGAATTTETGGERGNKTAIVAEGESSRGRGGDAPSKGRGRKDGYRFHSFGDADGESPSRADPAKVAADSLEASEPSSKAGDEKEKTPVGERGVEEDTAKAATESLEADDDRTRSKTREARRLAGRRGIPAGVPGAKAEAHKPEDETDKDDKDDKDNETDRDDTETGALRLPEHTGLTQRLLAKLEFESARRHGDLEEVDQVPQTADGYSGKVSAQKPAPTDRPSEVEEQPERFVTLVIQLVSPQRPVGSSAKTSVPSRKTSPVRVKKAKKSPGDSQR